jgi:hypothetical protein
MGKWLVFKRLKASEQNISYNQEQIIFLWDDDDDDSCFLLYQHTDLYFYSAISLKQQSVGRHVTSHYPKLGLASLTH